MAQSISCVSPASCTIPDHLPLSAWITHAPFAFWLAEQIRPRCFVELGTHSGLSFFSFCQAIDLFRLDTSAFAVDTWQGDEHAGLYDESVFTAVTAVNERYSRFSKLIRMTFDEALSYFDDSSVDLLHIDGRHYYEDVRHDYESWLPKLTDDAVVLFHDTNVRERDFGVWKVFQELKEHCPSFEFIHGHGFGIVCPGSRIPEGLRDLIDAELCDVETTRLAYSTLGSGVEFRQKSQAAEAVSRAQSELEAETDRRISQFREEAEDRVRMIDEEADRRIRLANEDAERRISEAKQAETARRLQDATVQASVRAAETARLSAFLAAARTENEHLRASASAEAAERAQVQRHVDQAMAEKDAAIGRIYGELIQRPTYPLGLDRLRRRRAAARAHRMALERLAGLGFDPDAYLDAYADVAASAMDPGEHYVMFGRAEGRRAWFRCELALKTAT